MFVVHLQKSGSELVNHEIYMPRKIPGIQCFFPEGGLVGSSVYIIPLLCNLNSFLPLVFAP